MDRLFIIYVLTLLLIKLYLLAGFYSMDVVSIVLVLDISLIVLEKRLYLDLAKDVMDIICFGEYRNRYMKLCKFLGDDLRKPAAILKLRTQRL